MENERLNKWAELLLDTGKGNNLINFKDSKATTVELIYPDFATILDRTEKSVRFEVYDPKIDEDGDDVALCVAAGKDVSPNEPDRGNRSPKEHYLAKYASRLKKNNICLAYNVDDKPLTALKNIKKRADSAMEETGVNLAYVAFGFIHWSEPDDPNRILCAPILLAPVNVEHESSVSPFFLNIAADISINPTFLYKMQTEHGIVLPEYDEEAPVEEYYEKVAKLVSKLGWSVSMECKVGLFAFQKINMYKDLKENASVILENGSVRALLNLPATEEEASEEEIGELHNVVDADSSQNQAIRMAASGKSFVLQGPPGTGKSQSITNIIAECLARGKKVLFVSEKRAALNVVYENLKRVGLDDFCLAMHSSHANKKDVIDELCRTLALPKSVVSARAQAEIDARERAKTQLDAYSEELHRIRPLVDMSVYDLYEEYSRRRSAPALDYVIADITQKGASYLAEADALLSHYTRYVDSIGYDYRKNSWYGFADTNNSYENKIAIREDLRRMTTCVMRLNSLAARLQTEKSITMNSLREAHLLRDFFTLMADNDLLTPDLFKRDLLEKVIASAKKMRKIAELVRQKKESITAAYSEKILGRPELRGYRALLSVKYKHALSRLFSGEYKTIIAELTAYRKNGAKLDYRAACVIAAELAEYHDAMEDFAALEKKVAPYLGRGYDGVDTDFSRLSDSMSKLLALLASKVDLGSFLTARGDLSAVYHDFKTSFDAAFSDSHEESLVARFDKEHFDLMTAELPLLLSKLCECRDHVDEIDNWLQFSKLLENIREADLLTYLDHALDHGVEAERLLPAYHRAYAAQWIDRLLQSIPVLSSLSRIPHDQAVEEFRKRDLITFEINKAVINAKLSADRPSLDLVSQGSSVALLRREGEKKRRQKSIRTLLAEIPELAQTLKPCFLMSPLSVSTYLGPDFRFDVVVFDEASQIFPQDAVGSVYRGKQLIVVGDSKQMPPSNFFTSSLAPDEIDQEEGEEDVVDFESILDLCATTFPQLSLKWHYRSRFEQLISFSNKYFYNNDLITFPSSLQDGQGVGVDYVYVDGIFDRSTRTNMTEAEKMVELVFEHIDKYPDRSLGVVAFSISQQNLIDRLIARRRQADPSKEEFFRTDRPEPFFVKNLETVQGDERDTILFSVAYGVGSDGKLLLNFGPINKAGGERRLNVAVTRAKFNIVILSSMHGSDIDPARTSSRGARLLGAYLDYAEKGPSVQGLGATEDGDCADIVDEVREFLEENGYQTETQVGFSTFKIDLAVKAPNARRYVLAIELDGPSYHEIKATRDRDRLRQGVLERMGWSFYRLWTTDWVKNNKAEKDRLLAAVRRALDEAAKSTLGVPADGVTPATPSFTETATEERFEFPVYPLVSEMQAMKQSKGDVAATVKAIVSQESPLNEEWLLKRICFMFGADKVTPTVRASYVTKLRDLDRLDMEKKGDFLCMKGAPVPMLRVPASDAARVREIKHISLEELANGIRAVVEKNVSVERLGLYRMLAGRLGAGRLTENITKRLDDALALICNDVDIDGDTLSRRNKS